jgi:hypothetical protein
MYVRLRAYITGMVDHPYGTTHYDMVELTTINSSNLASILYTARKK